MNNLKIAVVLLLPLTLGARCEWQGPSDHFIFLDQDQSSEISLDEWMVYYGTKHQQHAWYLCDGNDFEPADCDHNGELNWHEYYKYRFKHKSCDNLTNNDNIFHTRITNRPIQNADSRKWILVPVTNLDVANYCKIAIGLMGLSGNNYSKIIEMIEAENGAVRNGSERRSTCRIYYDEMMRLVGKTPLVLNRKTD